MRHMLNPLDFSVEEIDQLLSLASDMNITFPNMLTFVTARY